MKEYQSLSHTRWDRKYHLVSIQSRRKKKICNSKAEDLINTCRILLDQHGGEVPCDRAALGALPGVGRKTANVVLNTAFGLPTMAVDTHIFRVSNRTRIAPD
jgi:endonuclease III